MGPESLSCRGHIGIYCHYSAPTASPVVVSSPQLSVFYQEGPVVGRCAQTPPPPNLKKTPYSHFPNSAQRPLLLLGTFHYRLAMRPWASPPESILLPSRLWRGLFGQVIQEPLWLSILRALPAEGLHNFRISPEARFLFSSNSARILTSLPLQ